MLWQEEAYTRKDENGQPISFVGSGSASFEHHENLLGVYRRSISGENRATKDGSL